MTATVLAAAIMFAAFLAELAASRWFLKDDHHDLKDTGLNLVIGAGYLVSAGLTAIAISSVLHAAWSWSPARFDMGSAWHWLLLLFAEDFLYYWSHRASHRLRFMWVSHVVHHNSPKLNLSTGMRNSWVGGWLDWVFFLPLAAAGFPPLAIAAVQAIATAWDFLTHTPYLAKIRILDLVFNSPSNHRVHHSRDLVDSNYGGLFILWDRMFGTYRAETGPITYGTDEMPRRPHHPLHVEFYLWVDLLSRMWRTPPQKGR